MTCLFIDPKTDQNLARISLPRYECDPDVCKIWNLKNYQGKSGRVISDSLIPVLKDQTYFEFKDVSYFYNSTNGDSHVEVTLTNNEVVKISSDQDVRLFLGYLARLKVLADQHPDALFYSNSISSPRMPSRPCDRTWDTSPPYTSRASDFDNLLGTV